ncbi:hypothetical protein [Kitasatospora sp. SolWspMP-SS2h]|uniref:hypothetical protein n=1 Tax=Kitasatospora sp. SolWspMP-SS2h TaxID=1305729 RepID=UPI001314CA15|nr:hypothetical protein [Kitasatospora sp. SolWspMP-SS2h]
MTSGSAGSIGAVVVGELEPLDGSDDEALVVSVSACGGVVSDRFPCPAGTRRMGVPKLTQRLSALVDTSAVWRARRVVL